MQYIRNKLNIGNCVDGHRMNAIGPHLYEFCAWNAKEHVQILECNMLLLVVSQLEIVGGWVNQAYSRLFYTFRLIKKLVPEKYKKQLYFAYCYSAISYGLEV